MALLPNVPLNSGDEYTEEIANLAFNQVYDDQPQYLGHHERLTDDQLSNSAGQLKPRLEAIESSLLVTKATSGLTLSFKSGLVRLTDGSLFNVTAGQLVALDNVTSYVWVNNLGVVSTGLLPPVISLLLAKVTSTANNITNVIDLRSAQIRSVSPVASSIKSFGGVATSDYIAPANAVLDLGLYFFRNFIVPAGVTLTVSRWAKILCSGNVDIQGTLLVSEVTLGGRTRMYIVAPNQTPQGLEIGQGIGATANTYAFGLQPYGSGGQSGSAWTNAGSNTVAIWASGGGLGGGGLVIEAAGSITVSGTITAKGGNGTQGGTTAPNNPNATFQPGVFASGYTAALGGGSGGSGGCVQLSSTVSVFVTNTGTLDVRGGNGLFAQNDGIPNCFVVGGSGGGGGVVVLSAPSVNTTGSTILISGGATGSPVGHQTSSGSTYTTFTGSALIGTGQGGGFGGSTGGTDGAYNGATLNTYTFTTRPGTNGLLIVRNYAPLGS